MVVRRRASWTCASLEASGQCVVQLRCLQAHRWVFYHLPVQPRQISGRVTSPRGGPPPTPATLQALGGRWGGLVGSIRPPVEGEAAASLCLLARPGRVSR